MHVGLLDGEQLPLVVQQQQFYKKLVLIYFLMIIAKQIRMQILGPFLNS